MNKFKIKTSLFTAALVVFSGLPYSNTVQAQLSIATKQFTLCEAYSVRSGIGYCVKLEATGPARVAMWNCQLYPHTPSQLKHIVKHNICPYNAFIVPGAPPTGGGTGIVYVCRTVDMLKEAGGSVMATVTCP